jgi:hypothetical protein
MIEYYFLLEFSWSKEQQFSKNGFPRAKFHINFKYAEEHGWANYHILESVFTESNMLKIDCITKKIQDIKSVIKGEKKETQIFSESVNLSVKKDFTRIEDNLGDTEGIEAPISWNISTPTELQYIPTEKILQLFKDWKKFLQSQEKVTLIVS